MNLEDYPNFLNRLKLRERYGMVPSSRGPEKLAGVRRLLELMGNPEDSFKVVHIGGTNGKGMTAAMVSELLLKAGRSTGLYTSPHLSDIRERIVLNGQPIGESKFARIGHQVLDAAQVVEPGHYLSYFDLLTVMGFLAFHDQGVEWGVLEVGLGGKADATNTTGKDLAIITKIGLDHTKVLGDDLFKIAGEKLGITRAGIPTVLADQPAGLSDWINERLAEQGSPVISSEAIRLRISPEDRNRIEVKWPDGPPGEIVLPEGKATLPRLACAASALSAAEIILGKAQAEERQERFDTVLNTFLPGRLDYRENILLAGLPGKPIKRAMFDGAHNADALEALVAQLSRLGIKKYNLIFGMQEDKMVDSIRETLAQLFAGAARIITIKPQTPRAPSPENLAGFIASVPMANNRLPEISLHPTPLAALQETALAPDIPLVATGSLWMVGDLLALLALSPDIS